MNKFLALTFLGAFLLATPAGVVAAEGWGGLTTLAQQPSTCIPLAGVLDSIQKALPIKGIVKLDAEQTKRVVAWYNAQEPVSNDTYALAIVTMHEGEQYGLIMGNGDQACFAALVPPPLMRSFIDAVTGGQGV